MGSSHAAGHAAASRSASPPAWIVGLRRPPGAQAAFESLPALAGALHAVGLQEPRKLRANGRRANLIAQQGLVVTLSADNPPI